MAIRVYFEEEPKQKPTIKKQQEKSLRWQKFIPPSLIAPVVLGACQLKPVESRSPFPTTTPSAAETLPVEGTPVNLAITSVSFKSGYPQEFSPYADAIANAAKEDGVDPQILDGQWIKAAGPKGEVNYALMPFATVTGLTDPDGKPSDSKPVYYLGYYNENGNIKVDYAVSKLIETDTQGRVSFTARMIEPATFESWENNTQSYQTKLGQIIYAIPLKEGITIEEARKIQKEFIEGKITQEELLSQYTIGVSFVQPEKPDNFVSIASFNNQPTPATEPDLLQKAFDKLLGVTPAAAANLQYSATPAPTPEPTPIPTIEVNGLQFPDPRITNPELFDLKNKEAPIPKFANALKNAGINITPEQINEGITYVSTKADGTPLVDKDGNPFVVVVYNLDPSQLPPQYADLAGPIPLMIAEKGEMGWEWENLDILLAFTLYGKEISVRAEPGGGKQAEGLKHFRDWVITTTTEEATYNPTDPNSIVKEWQNGRSYLSIAESYVQRTLGRVIGGHLVWGFEGPPGHQILPDYLIKASNEQLLQYGLNHLEMVMRHFYTKFPNKKYDWTVVAEATRPNLFPRRLGLNLDNPDQSFVIQAYRRAQDVMNQFGRQRNNDADRLAYSDFITGLNDPHIPTIIDILKALKHEGLIDVFHLQIRYGPNLKPNRPLTAEELSGLIDRISGETGVSVMITELGFKNAAQSSVTQGFIHAAIACRDNPNCLGIQFGQVLPGNPNENELFSFENGHARPDIDYYAVISALVAK